MNSLHCLITQGGMLTSEMSNKLYQVARDMLKSGEKSKRFRSKIMEGVVTTELKYASMGSIYGTECTAEFECEDSTKKMTVKYIMMQPFLSDSLMEDGRWISVKDYMDEIAEEYADDPYFQQVRNAHNN